MQITDTILMIRPVNFRMNEQTVINNFFQEDLALQNELINANAQKEFDAFVEVLQSKGIHVVVIEDEAEKDTPDSIFPNNWVSFHRSGTVCLYPMFAENRRKERRTDILDVLKLKGFQVEKVVDYSYTEERGIYLEGTGSLIMDRVHQKVYCALSDRAHKDLVFAFCKDFDCTPVIFTANQSVGNQRLPIYHTNVMMALGEAFATICLDSIDDSQERKQVEKHLREDGKEIIPITEHQMHHFAGNMLQLIGKNEKRYTVMSSQAYKSLAPSQVSAIQAYSEIIHSPLDTIEACGGGSARCMMAEVFLPLLAVTN
ncbi:MAG: arginine deiminase-related protein [Bacteroidota bacterium]